MGDCLANGKGEEVADLKRGDNINVMLPSPNDSCVNQRWLSYTSHAHLMMRIILGFQDGWFKHILGHTHARTDLH